MFVICAVVSITWLFCKTKSVVGQLVCFAVTAGAVKFMLPFVFAILDKVHRLGVHPLAIVFFHPILVQLIYAAMWMFPSLFFRAFNLSNLDSRLWHLRNLAYGKTLVHFFLLAWYLYQRQDDRDQNYDDVLLVYYSLLSKQSLWNVSSGFVMLTTGLLLEAAALHVKTGVRLKWLAKLGVNPEIYPDSKRNIKHIGKIMHHLSMIRLFGSTLREVAYAWLLLYAFQTFIERDNRKRKVFIHMAAAISLVAAMYGIEPLREHLVFLTL
jgi:hypothetical protein